MNLISKRPLHTIGYQFIAKEFLPAGKDEYYLRNLQNRTGIDYRQLTAFEIEVLVRNSNTSDDWNKILVSDAFDPELVKNCQFFGLVRIGKLEAFFLEFHNLRLPVGLYNSTIISCDLGDNIVIHNVNYLSHFVVGNEVMIVNVNELATTNAAKFGVGIIKEGEKENIRIWLEVCNENGGRRIIPFNGMLPGDAFLWAKYRDDAKMLNRFKEYTQKEFDIKRGYYGKIGDRTVIKNCRIIKDAWIGSDAYIKGANKIKNVTINSKPDAMTQIGEGCELVNGIIGFGCRVFYGVKAVRFVLASHSQLKYGARLINSYLGNNSTISCCEVLNSLIFPAHEQHHNNSFLCAGLVMGQSNMAAGATIGSNHNSRSPDGELIAGRGFWPGLCVSLKHNSKFASFILMAKGDYPAELSIPLPFSLVINDVSNDQLQVMPAYWFMYNLYALTRNEWKYRARDLRTEKIQRLEFQYLAPDTIKEMLEAVELLEMLTGKAYFRKEGKNAAPEIIQAKGKELLQSKDDVSEDLEILAEGFENSSRKVRIIKAFESYHLYLEFIHYYLAGTLLKNLEEENYNTRNLEVAVRNKKTIENFINVGGQLIPEKKLNQFRQRIRDGKLKSWDEVHGYYEKLGNEYEKDCFIHTIACLQKLNFHKGEGTIVQKISQLLKASVSTSEYIMDGIFESRKKDYTNPFRKMVYDNKNEMNLVLGRLEENDFIRIKKEELAEYEKRVRKAIRHLK